MAFLGIVQHDFPAFGHFIGNHLWSSSQAPRRRLARSRPLNLMRDREMVCGVHPAVVASLPPFAACGHATHFDLSQSRPYKISLAHKDINLALGLGEEYGVPLPVAQVVKEDLAAAIAAGLGENGVDGVILPLEKAAGVSVQRVE